MSRDHLRDAGESLERAAEGLGDPDRARDLAATLRSLADRDRGPDHGRLARIEQALDELDEEADETASDRLAETRAHIQSYRETIEGV